MPASIYVIFVSACNVLICVLYVRSVRDNARMSKLLRSCMDIGAGQDLIIRTMLSRGIEVSCDYCGNPMAPNVPITVVEQEDGTVWVQHTSHGVG